MAASHNFAEIVRRDIGGHADGDAAGAVDEEVGNARGEDGGLFAGLIEIGDEVDGFFFEVGENVFGNFGEAGLGVPHGGGRIAVDASRNFPGRR